MNAIYKFFGTILGAFESWTGHYLLALFLFALLVKLVLLPFGIKQQKTSIKQAKLKPREMAIRNKYKGRTDQPTQQKMQNEIFELYQQEGYNPMGGCLPLLIQMPILLVIYQAVINPLRYICGYSAEMIEKIAQFVGVTEGNFIGRDIDLIQHITESNVAAINEMLGETGTVVLSEIPNFSLFGNAAALAMNPYFWSWLLLVPALNFAFTMLSSYLTKKLTFQPMQAQGSSQGNMVVMNIMMAGMTTFIAFTVPAAIGIYWIFNNLLGMLQQFILAKTMPLPSFTEEDYRKAEREYAGKTSKKEQIAKVKRALSQPMDDDEYVDLGDYYSVFDEKSEPQVKTAKDDSDAVIKKAPLKQNKNTKK